jgi:hypothetical protein
MLRLIGENIEVILSHYKLRKDRFPIIRSIDTTITILANGDGIIDERQVFEGVPGRPQNFIGLLFHSNQPISYLEREVQFVVHNPEAYQVALLPSGLLLKNLSLLVMFLPAIEAGKPPIDFSHRQVAKGVFLDLVNPGIRSDYYQTSIKSEGPVKRVRIRFRIAQELGTVELKKRGSSYGREIAVSDQISDPGYRNYTWEANDIPDEGQIGVTLVRNGHEG